MFKTILPAFIVSLVLLLVALFAMAFRVLFIKGGKFPNAHIGASKAMKERGISCATSQDREARSNFKKKKISK